MKRRATIKEIALESGVSVTTVSRIINHKEGYYTKETEQKVRDVIQKLDYHPNYMARSLAMNTTHLIGIIVPHIYNGFFQDLFKGAEDYLFHLNYKLILCNTDGDHEKEREFLHSLGENFVDGIIITTSNDLDDNKPIVDLYQKGMPIVTVERYGKDLDGIPQILFANREAEEAAVKYLYNHGHRNIAYISGPHSANNAVRRQEGFINGMKNCGLSVNKNLIMEGNYYLDSGKEAMSKLLKERNFSAVIAANDLMAIGASEVIQDSGLKIPEDISIIGCDGTVAVDMYRPKMSTILLNGEKMGRTAAQLLMNLINKKENEQTKILFQPELRITESVCDCKK